MMGMKIKLTLPTLVLSIWAATVYAQYGPLERLKAAIDKTDEIIQQAREVVAESGSERARNQLAMAVRLQGMARDIIVNMLHDLNDTRVTQIGKYTMSARLKAQRAIAIVRQEEENEDYVRRRLEKTDQLIRQVSDEFRESSPPALRLLLDTAEEQQQRAAELFRNRRLKAALQVTIQTEKSLAQALERRDGLMRAQNRFETQMDRYLALRERIETGGDGGSATIADALRNAEKLRTQADDLAAEDKYGRAEKVMTEAVEMLSRVAEQVREPAKIKAALDDLRTEADRIREQVEIHTRRDIQEQFRTMLGHLDKAGQFHDRGDYDAAAAQLQAARQLLSRIKRALGE